MAKVIFGNHASVLVPAKDRDNIRLFYVGILGGKLVQEDPQRDFICLGEAEKPFNVEILDLTGNVILKQTNYSDNKININALNKGLYIVKVVDNNTNKSGMLLKNKNK